MRSFIFKHPSDPTESAHQICEDLEASLGISLKNNDPVSPNVVHGYLNTSSNGDIEVHVYEIDDIKKINNMPWHHEENGIKYALKHPGVQRECSQLSDDDLASRVYFHASQNRWIVHPKMNGGRILKR